VKIFTQNQPVRIDFIPNFERVDSKLALCGGPWYMSVVGEQCFFLTANAISEGTI
jgi:hypothetical protein